MLRFSAAPLALAILFFCTDASAQRAVVYDTVSEATPAAISCGFCAGEKFGVVFRPLDSGRGLSVDEFPLTLNRIDVAVARMTVTGSFWDGAYQCQGSTETGRVPMTVEAYAGATAPRGDIGAYPATGPWPGETELFSQSIELEPSVESSPGSARFNVQINQIPISPGVRIDPPNTYIRVAVSIPSGGASTACAELLTGAMPGPLAVPVRDDDGRIEGQTSHILSGGGVGDGWMWNDDTRIQDPATLTIGINGDWLIRLDVNPIPTTRDAGMPRPDAGPTVDAGPTIDAGPTMDAGSTRDSGGTPACTLDRDCAGGERCVEGMCQSVSCAAPSDCAGGMTCVSGTCRNLCDSSSDCDGGEVCDTGAGYCVLVAAPAGGCGCRVADPRSSAPAALALIGLALAGLLVRRRRR